MTNCLHKGVKRLVFSVFAIMVAGCLYAVTKTATFDFSNPASLNPPITMGEGHYVFGSTEEFTNQDITLMISRSGVNKFSIRNVDGKLYLGLKTGNQIKILKQSELIVSEVRFYHIEDKNGNYLWTLNDVATDINKNGNNRDGNLTLIGDIETITMQNNGYAKKIEIEYEIEEAEQPEVPEIKDMPSTLTKTEFNDFDGTVSEQTDYVIAAGNVVATGNLLENGHLEVVRFVDGTKAFPVDYAFRFKELYDGEYVIQNKRNKYLSAGENGHFALTDLDEEALLWNVSADGSKVIISESSMSRAGGKSILFSESMGGFGRYNTGGDAVAPSVYAYTSPTTAIAELIENDDAEPVYYDLRGNMLDRDMLSPGIYICRKGLEVTKVVIK